MMFHTATTLSTGNYILSWNVGDWYHPTLLSIFADRVRNTYDCVTLPRIINKTPNNDFTVSEWSIMGWSNIVMIRKDKYIPYTGEEEWLLQQWKVCASISLLDEGSELLYVSSEQKTNGYELEEIDREYYQTIFNRESHPSSMTNIYRRVYEYIK